MRGRTPTFAIVCFAAAITGSDGVRADEPAEQYPPCYFVNSTEAHSGAVLLATVTGARRSPQYLPPLRFWINDEVDVRPVRFVVGRAELSTLRLKRVVTARRFKPGQRVYLSYYLAGGMPEPIDPVEVESFERCRPKAANLSVVNG